MDVGPICDGCRHYLGERVGTLQRDVGTAVLTSRGATLRYTGATLSHVFCAACADYMGALINALIANGGPPRANS